ncbi:leucine-rich repeat domain-containing protein [Neobacillus niacini]|uniref:leucine-rich repeat domain-containing protein n=1 Tax=Neobacillus niacini TaxID=86668 RepID=UPI00398399A1
MHNRKWTNLTIVLVLLFSLFNPFTSLKTYASAGLQILDVTEKQESTVIVWEVVNDKEEELTNYQLIKNGEILDIEPVPLQESAEDDVKRYSYEDQNVEKNAAYTYEITANSATGEKLVSAPFELTFVGEAAEAAEEVDEDTQTKLAASDEAEVEVVTTNIKVVSDQGNIPWALDFSVEGISDETAEISYYGYLDEDGFFVDYDSESRDLELPIGTYRLGTYNYSTEEEIFQEFTIESGKDYVTTPVEMVLPDEKLAIKKAIKIEAVNDQSITMGWDEPYNTEEVEKYLVYLNDELVETIDDPFTTYYSAVGLSPETFYQVKVEYVYKDGTIETLSADVTTSPVPKGEVVVFDDDNLKNAIKRQLNIDHRDIYTDDMESLTFLDASYSEIHDLTGLEFAVNLVDLMLYGNQIENLSALKNLTNLVFLDLDENMITSLDDLRGLKNLETLFLAFNQIEDIQILKEFPKLSSVTLYGNEGLDFTKGSKDAEVLKSLITAGVSVEWLLDSNEILIKEATESKVGIELVFPGLADFISNYQLYLDGELVAEIPASETEYEFSNLDPLTDYEITVDAVDQDGSIWGSAFTYLTTPPVPEGEVVQFKDAALKEAVRDALHLYSRDLYESDMTMLTSLEASDRGIRELDGLETAVNLMELHLDSNSVQNLEPIAGLTNLYLLSISNNKLSDLTSLAPLTNLEALLLDNNELKDISILSAFTKLNMLSLQGNKIQDIKPLTGLNLEYLNIGYNEIEDISSLLTLDNLQYVLLMKNPLDFSEGSEAQMVIRALEDNGVMVNYEYLDISVNKVSENSIEISWVPVTVDDYRDFLYYIVVDGEEVATDFNGTSYNLNDLQPDTEYSIEIMGLSVDLERFAYGTAIVKTAAVQENPGETPGETPGENPGETPEENPEQNPEEPGDGAVEEGKNPTDQETAPGKVTENGSTPDTKETSKTGRLPNTATNSFNLLLAGVGLVVLGAAFYAVSRRKAINR